MEDKIFIGSVISVWVIFILIGFPLSDSAVNDAIDLSQKYNKALKIKDKETFDYAIDTQQGDILTQAKIKAVDGVKFDEMNKDFLYVKKIREDYTRHVRHIPAVKDSKGKTITPARTEVYYSWDYGGSRTAKSKNITIFDNKYELKHFSIGSTNRISANKITKKAKGTYYYTSGTTRYYYYVKNKEFNSTFIAKSDGKFPQSSGGIELNDGTIESQIEMINMNVETVGYRFWTFYIIFGVVATGMAIYIKND